MRIGQGFDVHRVAEGRELVLGGVRIPDHPGLAGHSDADVVGHAVADAILGAAALGDLGAHFPDTDRWRDASSMDILREVGRLLRAEGSDLVNVDATVIAESPRLGPHLPAMVANIAEALGVEPSIVSVKATSTDGLGTTGRGEGIAAAAVVLITS